MDRFPASSLKLHFSSHDLGRVFKIFTILKYLISPCNRILLFQSNKRRAFVSSGKALTKDVSLFVFIAYNIFLFVIGFVCILAGVSLYVMHKYSKVHTYLSLATIMTLAGISVLVMSLVGFAGATTVKRRTLRLYLALALIAVIVALAATFVLFKMSLISRTNILLLSSDLIKAYRHASDDQQHSPFINGIVDFVQSKSGCCGARGPIDWALLNSMYIEKHDSLLPDSCTCNISNNHEVCKRVVLPYRTSRRWYRPVNESVWSVGCGDKFLTSLSEFRSTAIKCIVALVLSQVSIIFITVYLLQKRRKIEVSSYSSTCN
ncbi:PREDICTED: uroplakin-1b-like [Amphimedon queenslandica]|uniref:Tetraspanin n=1 Tax=Amphimedon queenslandica TaxID=400682 RepID=A0A1X7VH18_AMPQE|nr:PREDICTED: uroplakin-1b-like [Amphimedon queenslandica]|eukprot:XP_003384217.1 PREDICTED: uroplakin-1b-like [Amphimedon queenslandica]